MAPKKKKEVKLVSRVTSEKGNTIPSVTTKEDGYIETEVQTQEKFIPSQKLQKNHQRRLIHINTTLILILMGVVGFLLYTSLVSTKELAAENSSIRNQLAQFLSNDPVTIYENKTFIRYDQEPLAVTIYSSTTCSTCALEVEKITTKLQASLPTLQNITILDTDEEDVLNTALKLGIGYLPGIVFSQDIVETNFYKEGEEFFSEKSDGSQQFYTHTLGHTPVKFIATTRNLVGFPSQDPLAETERENQTDSAPVEIHAFLTTDCPACKTARDTIRSIEQTNPNVKVVEHFAENLQSTPHAATKAIACAHQAGKGTAFTNTLFARQAAWLAVTDRTTAFERYARDAGIPTETFTTCIAQKNTDIDKQNRLFQTFGVSQVPTIFIGNEQLIGVQTVTDLNNAISEASKL